MAIDLEQLTRWSEQLCTLPPLDFTHALRALGIPGSLVPRSRTYAAVQPAPAGASWLALSLDHLGTNAGHLSTVEVAPAQTITRGELDRRFGAGVELPRIGDDAPHVVTYDVRVAAAPFACTVSARFSGAPTAASAVDSIRLRRDAVDPPAPARSR